MKTPTLVMVVSVDYLQSMYNAMFREGRVETVHSIMLPEEGHSASKISHYLEALLAKAEWMPRAQAEEDERYRQFIPYVSIWGTDNTVLVYRRPGKGEGESRLQGQRSIGFGGHVDQPDYAAQGLPTPDVRIDPVSHLHGAMVRELQEEAGAHPFERRNLGSGFSVRWESKHTPKLRSVICLHDAQVSRVHLGIHYVWKPNLTPEERDSHFTFAPDEIHEPQWVDPRELSKDPTLETWSQEVLRCMERSFFV